MFGTGKGGGQQKPSATVLLMPYPRLMPHLSSTAMFDAPDAVDIVLTTVKLRGNLYNNYTVWNSRICSQVFSTLP